MSPWPIWQPLLPRGLHMLNATRPSWSPDRDVEDTASPSLLGQQGRLLVAPVQGALVRAALGSRTARRAWCTAVAAEHPRPGAPWHAIRRTALGRPQLRTSPPHEPRVCTLPA